MLFKVGSLVEYVVNQPGFPKRHGIIYKSYRYDNGEIASHGVRFFDGKEPESNSFRERDLKVVSK